MYWNLSIISVFTFFILIALSEYSSKAFSQDETTPSIVKNDSWISARNNLNITINLKPTLPIIDEITKLSFKIQSLSGSMPIQDLRAKITITDHDGRLYKFQNKFLPVTNGQFSVDYIFPDDGEHRLILQLYENMTPYTVSSFDLSIPHPTPPSQTDKLLKPFTDFFDSIF